MYHNFLNAITYCISFLPYWHGTCFTFSLSFPMYDLPPSLVTTPMHVFLAYGKFWNTWHIWLFLHSLACFKCICVPISTFSQGKCYLGCLGLETWFNPILITNTTHYHFVKWINKAYIRHKLAKAKIRMYLCLLCVYAFKVKIPSSAAFYRIINNRTCILISENLNIIFFTVLEDTQDFLTLSLLASVI